MDELQFYLTSESDHDSQNDPFQTIQEALDFIAANPHCITVFVGDMKVEKKVTRWQRLWKWFGF